MAVPLDPAAICLAGILACANPRLRPIALGVLLFSMAVGDFFAGLSVFHLVFRTAGLLALALAKPADAKGRTTAWHLLAHHALWSALPPELRGDFPLTYLYAVTFLQGLLFYALFSPLLPKGQSPGRQTLLTGMAIPAGVFLLWVFFRPFRVWPPPTLGDTGGLWVRLLAFPLLLLPLVSPALSRMNRKSPRKKKNTAPKAKEKSSKDKDKDKDKEKEKALTWRDLAD
ncbi:MAG: hypothetical protein LAT83_19530 [Kiritimatiellae bacterium]|nr:hypothetical protein [Kiritimatiellia bacterium]